MDIVHPGWIISKNDGDRHYISFKRLCKLYHLNPHARTTIDDRNLVGVRIPDDAKHYWPAHDYPKQ